MEDNPDCEFGKWFPSSFNRGPACDPHHLWGGTSGRDDTITNLIALSREAHDWCHTYPTEGRVIGLWVKYKKMELNEDEFKAASGKTIAGWLASKPVEDGWVKYYYDFLVEKFS